MAKKTKTQELQYLGQMLTATSWRDRRRLKSIALRLLEIIIGVK